jgi:hypothetical protein
LETGVAIAWFVVALFSGGLIDYPLTAATYVFLVWWYGSGCRSGREMTAGVRSVVALSLMLSFFKLYANTMRVVTLTATGPKFVRMLEVLGTEFALMFVPTLILSPLLFSISRNRRLVVTAVVASPTFLFNVYMLMTRVGSPSVSIGAPSAQFLGAAAALYLAAMLIDPLLKARRQEKGCRVTP